MKIALSELPTLSDFLATKLPATMTVEEVVLASKLNIKEIYFVSEQEQKMLKLDCSCVVVTKDGLCVTIESTPQTVSSVLYSLT